MSLNEKSFAFNRLKGQQNYTFWSLRIESYLIEKGCFKAISDDNIEDDIKAKALAIIRLSIEDGPLLQIQNKTSPKET